LTSGTAAAYGIGQGDRRVSARPQARPTVTALACRLAARTAIRGSLGEIAAKDAGGSSPPMSIARAQAAG